jgi:uncharacterized protein YcbX
MHLESLHIYPVKSLRGLSPDSVEIDTLGASCDRRFMVVDPEGTFMTQRTWPQMARVGAWVDRTSLGLTSDGFGGIRVGLMPDPAAPRVTVRIWKSGDLKAEDCGGEASAWLSRVIGTACRLVRIGPDFCRPLPKAAARPGDVVAFADAVPFLVIGRSSLDCLNDRIVGAGGEAVPMNRFRPNLVIEGSGPFEEDTWSRIRVGSIVFRSVGPCVRCLVPTTDQLTGVRGTEPMRTLATFRRDTREPTHVNFGQNLVHETMAGMLRVGDPVEILQ